MLTKKSKVDFLTCPIDFSPIESNQQSSDQLNLLQMELMTNPRLIDT